MKKMSKMLNDQSTDVLKVRELSESILNANVKIFEMAKAGPYQWFVAQEGKGIEKFEDNYKMDLIAFKSAIARLKAMKPNEWTLLDMSELGRRMLNEIIATDELWKMLHLRRSNCIDLRRADMKDELKKTQQKAMHITKLSKPWIEHGGNKVIVTVLAGLGACY